MFGGHYGGLGVSHWGGNHLGFICSLQLQLCSIWIIHQILFLTDTQVFLQPLSASVACDYKTVVGERSSIGLGFSMLFQVFKADGLVYFLWIVFCLCVLCGSVNKKTIVELVDIPHFRPAFHNFQWDYICVHFFIFIGCLLASCL